MVYWQIPTAVLPLSGRTQDTFLDGARCTGVRPVLVTVLVRGVHTVPVTGEDSIALRLRFQESGEVTILRVWYYGRRAPSTGPEGFTHILPLKCEIGFTAMHKDTPTRHMY